MSQFSSVDERLPQQRFPSRSATAAIPCAVPPLVHRCSSGEPRQKSYAARRRRWLTLVAADRAEPRRNRPARRSHLNAPRSLPRQATTAPSLREWRPRCVETRRCSTSSWSCSGVATRLVACSSGDPPGFFRTQEVAKAALGRHHAPDRLAGLRTTRGTEVTPGESAAAALEVRRVALSVDATIAGQQIQEFGCQMVPPGRYKMTLDDIVQKR
jgi:hypothetical protein